MMIRLPTVLASCAILISSTAFAADPTGPEVLVKIDEALNAFKDAIFESKLLVKQPDGQAREYGFVTQQKGNKRLVRFTSPGDVKGMGVLVESDASMYVFLPGFQRVRRMGTHVKNQTFMGSDFGYEDMSQTSFSVSYDAKLVGADDKNWIIDMTPKPKMEVEYGRIKVWTDKTMWQPTKLEYYDEKGKLLKTQERLDYHKDSPTHWQPGRIVMTDHRRNDHKSEIVFTASKIDSGLNDDLFSVRSLVRGN
jgi:outer membrane lipoprotein-sorting protein